MKRNIILIIVAGLFLVTMACGGSDGGSGGGQPSNITITVNNQSPYDVCYVLISSSEDTDWGEDQLNEEEVILPGSDKAFEMDPGTYDIILLDCEQIPVESVQAVSSDTTITVGGQGVVALLFDNQSSTEVCYVFISPSENEDWGEDWLGGVESVSPGNRRIFYMQPGTYDLLAQDCDGNDAAEELGISLTDEVTTWTLTD